VRSGWRDGGLRPRVVAPLTTPPSGAKFVVLCRKVRLAGLMTSLSTEHRSGLCSQRPEAGTGASPLAAVSALRGDQSRCLTQPAELRYRGPREHFPLQPRAQQRSELPPIGLGGQPASRCAFTCLVAANRHAHNCEQRTGRK